MLEEFQQPDMQRRDHKAMEHMGCQLVLLRLVLEMRIHVERYVTR